jgi:hypothetical protein
MDSFGIIDANFKLSWPVFSLGVGVYPIGV